MDRLVPVGAPRLAARTLAQWHVEIAPEVGSVPELEGADWAVDAYRRWQSPSVHPAD